MCLINLLFVRVALLFAGLSVYVAVCVVRMLACQHACVLACSFDCLLAFLSSCCNTRSAACLCARWLGCLLLVPLVFVVVSLLA